jgi:hypothetical protein
LRLLNKNTTLLKGFLDSFYEELEITPYKFLLGPALMLHGLGANVIFDSLSSGLKRCGL